MTPRMVEGKVLRGDRMLTVFGDEYFDTLWSIWMVRNDRIFKGCS